MYFFDFCIVYYINIIIEREVINMKFKTLINVLEDVEKRFFIDGMKFDIDRAEIVDNRQFITVNLQGILGKGRIRVSIVEANAEEESFEWDGTLQYRPELEWFGQEGWMDINIYRS